ncbi:MAG TPA: tetratricopeptide repeat protein, partial [bacterium]|nr:tetratricopeptide repeat protein [bacterium]
MSRGRRPARAGWRRALPAGVVLLLAGGAAAWFLSSRESTSAAASAPRAAVSYDADGRLVGRFEAAALSGFLEEHGLPAPASPLGPMEAGIATELEKSLAAVARLPLAPSYGQLGQILDYVYCQNVARAAYETAHRLAPDDHRWPHYLGALAEAAGNAAAAETHYRLAVELRPDFAATRGRLGWLLLRQNRLDEAEAMLREVTRREPSLPYPYTGLGRIAMKRARPDAALPWLEEALGRDPSDPETHALLARIHAGRGDREAAATHARRAGPARKPDVLFRDPLAHERLRVSGALLNHRREAQRQYDQGDLAGMIATLEYVVQRDSSDMDTL